MVINTNISAQNSATLLMQSSKRLAESLSKLSSGSKITTAADDAAGLAVSMRTNAQIAGTNAASNNLADALSFSQTQDGYLAQINTALGRMSELAIAAQDVTKTSSDRSLYNQEFQSLSTYVSDIQTKDFNGVSLFSGNAMNVTTAANGDSFSMSGISGNYVAAGVTRTTTTTNTVGYDANTQLGNVSSGFASNPNDGHIIIQDSSFNVDANLFLQPTNTIDDLVNGVNGSGGAATANYDASSGQLSITVNAGYRLISDVNGGAGPGSMLVDLGLATANGGQGQLDIDNMGGSSPITISGTLTHSVTTTSTTTTSSMDISSVSGAAAALTQIKSSIDQLASDRATVGANIERMNYSSEQLDTLRNNLAAANSRITDVDVAAESTNYARDNILVQAGTSMLAQANSLPQSVLRLLS